MLEEISVDKSVGYVLKSGAKPHKLTKEDSRKGGSRKTFAKRLGAIVRHLKKKNLSVTQIEVIKAIEEKKLDEAALVILMKQMSEAVDLKERDTILKRIISMLPAKTMNLNLERGEYTINLNYDRPN